jgi:hypothetical protein
MAFMGHFYHLASGMIFSSVAIREKSWTMRWRVAYFQRKPTYWWMWNRWIPPDCPVSNLPWKNVPYILRMDAIESEETNHCQSEFTIQICNWWYPLETFDLWCVCGRKDTFFDFSGSSGPKNQPHANTENLLAENLWFRWFLQLPLVWACFFKACFGGSIRNRFYVINASSEEIMLEIQKIATWNQFWEGGFLTLMDVPISVEIPIKMGYHRISTLSTV